METIVMYHHYHHLHRLRNRLLRAIVENTTIIDTIIAVVTPGTYGIYAVNGLTKNKKKQNHRRNDNVVMNLPAVAVFARMTQFGRT